jgi:hypothetical protein
LPPHPTAIGGMFTNLAYIYTHVIYIRMYQNDISTTNPSEHHRHVKEGRRPGTVLLNSCLKASESLKVVAAAASWSGFA